VPDQRDGDLSNEEFRLLVLRSLQAGDCAATDRLIAYFDAKNARKIQKFPISDRDDARNELLNAGFKAASKVLEQHIDKPRNYTMRAVTHAFRDLLRRKAAQREVPADPDHGVLAEAEALGWTAADREEHVANRMLLAQFKRQCRDLSAGRGSTRHKVAEVIELCYLHDLSESEACELLEFGPTEADTVRRTLHRLRSDPQSPLYRLTSRVVDEGVLDD
jgi:DNA-directed RNA polymerase specialized sigma24 family protein